MLKFVPQNIRKENILIDFLFLAIHNPYRKASHFFSSFLLPPPSFDPGTTAKRKNVVRRSFPKERQPNKTLHILSFLPRFIRSTIILSSDESKTKKEAMMSFHTRSCNLT